ncbi:MAG: PH domain-containing protein [Gammaproteobacteria bacterium]|nr:PH domain-containing protein [Gammaproteobacteria bacterium]
MAYIDKNLFADEKILFRTKKSLIIFLSPLCWTIATVICFINPNPYITKIAFAPGIAAIFFWLNQFIQYTFSDFAITNKRILMREGFFYRHTNDTRLTTIANVTVNQSLLGQALNYGTVFINTFGGEADPFTEIDKPFIFQKTLQNQIEQLTTRPNTL